MHPDDPSLGNRVIQDFLTLLMDLSHVQCKRYVTSILRQPVNANRIKGNQETRINKIINVSQFVTSCYALFQGLIPTKWNQMNQKTKSLILESLDNVLQQQHISMTRHFDILSFFQIVGLFSDKGNSTRQVALRIIMNTKVYMILETLSISFGMVKGILK